MGRDHGISIYPVLLVNFIGTSGFSIVIPILAVLVDRYGGNGTLYGLLEATYPALQLIGAPVLGRWSDIYGRRKVLLLSQGGSLVAWCMFLGAMLLPETPLFRAEVSMLGAFFVTLPLIGLFVSRALDGLTGGNVSVAHAYLADITPDEDRSRNFGKMAMASNLGYIVGPALAGLLATTVLGEILPVAVAMLISLAATLVIAFYLPESHKCALGPAEQTNLRQVMGQEQRDCYAKQKEDAPSMRVAVRQPYVLFMLVLYFFIYLGFNFFYAAFPIHAITTLDWTIGALGTYYAFLSVLMVLVQGPVLSFVSGRLSETWLMVIGGVILGTGFLLLTSHDIVIIYVAAAVFSLGNGVMWPSFLSVLSKVAGDYQGTVQGIGGSCGSAASIIGLIAGGVLYDAVGSATFVVSAVVIYFTSILAARALRFRLSEPDAGLEEAET